MVDNTALLERIAVALEARNGTGTTLGFGHPPQPRIIYVKNEGDYLWYFYNHDTKKQDAINHRALTGTITDLQRFDKDFQGKPEPKLRVTVQADQTYIIQSGLDSVFSKGLLFSLLSLKGRPNFPVTIAVQGNDPSDNGGLATVFCNLYVNNERIIPEWDREADSAQLLSHLQQVWGIEARADEPATTSAGNHDSGDADKKAQAISWIARALKTFMIADRDHLAVYRHVLSKPSLKSFEAAGEDGLRTIIDLCKRVKNGEANVSKLLPNTLPESDEFPEEPPFDL